MQLGKAMNEAPENRTGSPPGYVAMVLGIVFSVSLGAGLMALIF